MAEAPTYPDSMMVAWLLAAIEAQEANASEIEPAHLLLGLAKLCDHDLDDLDGAIRVLGIRPDLDSQRVSRIVADAGPIRSAFQRAGVDPAEFRWRLRDAVAEPDGLPAANPLDMHRTAQAKAVFTRADQLANTAGEPAPRPVHLLHALLAQPQPPWKEILAEQGLEEPLERFFPVLTQQLRPGPGSRRTARPRRPTPTLDQVGRDLSELARAGGLRPLIGRRDERRRLAHALLLLDKPNAILVGDAGVGKTAIVEGLAQALIDKQQPEKGGGPPEDLRGLRIVELAMASLVAGTVYRGQFEERMREVVKEASQPEIVLFIDEIHTLLGAGGEGSSDAANILKPALARGELRLIGATTADDYRLTFERDSALERRFTRIDVEEPTEHETLEILQGLKARYEAHHAIAIEPEALSAAVELSQRYLPDQRLPDKAISLLDEACAVARFRTFSPVAPPPLERLGRAELEAIVAQRVGAPREGVSLAEAEQLRRMEEALSRRVIGQAEAVSALAAAVRRARAGIRDRTKPIGVFLFAGATGSGKTELARGLAEFLHGDESRLVRIDMSEYMEPHSVSRLLGAPPGYVGYDDEGQLAGPLRRHAASVVLFDEIEKAHPRVLDLLLQIADRGELTDAKGRQVRFKDAVVILTSNLGSSEPGKSTLGFGTPETITPTPSMSYHKVILDGVKAALRPELIGRLDQIIVFHPLDKSSLRRVIDKLLAPVHEKLGEHSITLELDDDAYAVLLDEGFDPRYGARNLQHTLNRLVADRLSRLLLDRHLADGARLSVHARAGVLVFDAEEPAAPAGSADAGTGRPGVGGHPPGGRLAGS
jgi:ATP-dependent Clp protease ATP-binding subunit ClpC